MRAYPHKSAFRTALVVFALLFAARPAAAQHRLPNDAEHFRGRPRRVEPGEALAWVPRVIFFPLHLVSEYGLRRPIRAAISLGEQHHVVAHVNRILNPTPAFSWWPSAVVDLGILTSAGAGLSWRNALVRGNDFRFSVSTGGTDFWHLVGQDRVQLGPFSLGVRGDFLTRPDREFYGLGPASRYADRAYYRLTRGDVMAIAGVRVGTGFAAEVSGGYRRESTSGDTGDGWQPSVSTQHQPGAIPGLQLLSLLMLEGRVSLDSRPSRETLSGLRVTLQGRYAQDTTDPEMRFASFEAEAEAAVEVSRPGRVLALSLYTMDTQPLGREEVPFTHMAILGRARLPGFRWGRYIGPSAIVAELTYRYPVWTHLDAVWLAAVGNVFGRHFAGFDAALFAGSYGVGLRTVMGHRDAVQFMIALGTRRFDEAFGIDNVRFYVAVNPGLR